MTDQNNTDQNKTQKSKARVLTPVLKITRPDGTVELHKAKSIKVYDKEAWEKLQKKILADKQAKASKGE